MQLSARTLEALGALKMCSGEGDGKGAACIMHQARIAEALEAGREWPSPGDAASCVSPIIRAWCIQLNDDPGWGSDEERAEALRPLLPRIMGTAGSPELEMRRAWRSIDWVVREEGAGEGEGAGDALAARGRAIAFIAELSEMAA